MPIESSIQPERAADKPRTDFIDRTYQSWVEQGFTEYIPHSVEAPYTRLEDFLTAAGERPITREVITMKREKHNGKEYLIVNSVLHSKTWTGEDITTDYVDGYHVEQTRKPVIDQQNRVVSYTKGQQKEVYSIPFDKKTVDKFIGTQDKALIKFFIEHEGGPQNDYFTYDQFVNNTWEQNMKMLLEDGSPQYRLTATTNVV